MVDAKKERYGAGDLAKLFAGAARLVIVKGKKQVELDLARKPGGQDLAAALGPSGNLRAPTVRKGRTIVVGFSPEVWSAEL